MKLHELQYTEGSRSNDYRRGRGIGSGNGKTAGKGHKGQNSRSGGGVALGFEGGQMPLWRRLPKRGFKNVNRVNYAAVNVGDLNNFKDGTVVTPALLHEAGLVRKDFNGIKVLGAGKLERKLTVQAHAFSNSAKEAIEALGGVAELIKR